MLKKDREKIEKISESVSEIKDTLKNKEFEKYRNDSLKLNEITDQLKHVKLKVKYAGYSEDENGNKYIKVMYDAPTLLLAIDDNGNIIRNETFRSINMLNLISPEDMAKLSSLIKNAKNVK